MKNIYNTQPQETSPATGHQYKELYWPLKEMICVRIYWCENTFMSFCQLRKLVTKKYREKDLMLVKIMYMVMRKGK